MYSFARCSDEKVMADDEFTCDLFRFLQLLCEGHNNGEFLSHMCLWLSGEAWWCPTFCHRKHVWVPFLLFCCIRATNVGIYYFFPGNHLCEMRFRRFVSLFQIFRTTWELKQAAPRPSMSSSALWTTCWDYRSGQGCFCNFSLASVSLAESVLLSFSQISPNQYTSQPVGKIPLADSCRVCASWQVMEQ